MAGRLKCLELAPIVPFYTRLGATLDRTSLFDATQRDERCRGRKTHFSLKNLVSYLSALPHSLLSFFL
jgi:hypothetical protein